MFSLKNIPNFLTILRIVLIPSIVVCIEIDNQQYYWIALFLYVTACFSDFFDGYLARKFDIESNFGRFLEQFWAFLGPLSVTLKQAAF